MTEEFRGLRGDLHQQVALVAHWDEVIGRLRDQACTQWASGWLAFQRWQMCPYPWISDPIRSDQTVEKSVDWIIDMDMDKIRFF